MKKLYFFPVFLMGLFFVNPVLAVFEWPTRLSFIDDMYIPGYIGALLDDYGLLPIILTVTQVFTLLWINRLYRKMTVLRYCYIHLSDWIANHLDAVVESSRWMAEDIAAFQNRSENVDDIIYDDLIEGPLLWSAKVDYHFEIMRSNGVRLPSNYDYEDWLMKDWFIDPGEKEPKTRSSFK